MSRKSVSVAAAGLGMLLVAGTGAAFADPNTTASPGQQYRQLVGTGSDTTQSVLNGLSNVVFAADGTTKLLGSYDATGGQSITTRDPAANANCTFNRPVGSGAGRDALSTAVTNTNYANKDFSGTAAPKNIAGCVDFARSSSYSSSVASGDTAGGHVLTYVPFATDAVTFATLSTSSVPRKLTQAQLKSIYQCTFGSPQAIKPVLPQASSGTRQFFLSSIGLSSSATIPAPNADGSVALGTGTGLGSCVRDTTAAGAQVMENDGTYLVDGNSILPFSSGQFVAQLSGQQTNSLGRAALGSISNSVGKFASSLYINPSTAAAAAFPFTRDLYNVIPTAKVSDSTFASLFVGSGSKVCSQPDVIQQFGFNVSPSCGDTVKQSG